MAAPHQEKQELKVDSKELRRYIDDRQNVFGDADRFGLAVLVAFLHYSVINMEHILKHQSGLGMNLSEQAVQGILGDWVKKGYVEKNGEAYSPTQRMFDALERDGITAESLDREAAAFLSL